MSTSVACSATIATSIPAYEIVPTGELPVLDLSRSVRSEISKRFAWLLRHKAAAFPLTEPYKLDHSLLSSRRARIWLTMYWIGHMLAALVFVVPRSPGAVAAIAAVLLTVPGSVWSVSLLHLDMVKLLMETNEFWYMFLINTSTCVMLGIGFADLRAVISVVIWFGSLHMGFADANTALMPQLVHSSIAAGALCSTVLLSVEFNFIDGWTSTTVVGLNERDVTSRDLCSNGLVILMIFNARAVYRRIIELREQLKVGCTMLRCINWRHRLTMRAQRDDSTGKQRFTGRCPPNGEFSAVSFPKSSLYVICRILSYDAAKTYYPVQLMPLRWSWMYRFAFMILAFGGGASTIAVFIVYPSQNTPIIAAVGLAFTVIFAGIFFGLYQRDLLHQLIRNFDFLFLSGQFTLGLGSVAWLFDWDIRSVAVISMWIWIHWLITIDALTPLMKEKIGYRVSFLVPVILAFILAEVRLFHELAVLDNWKLEDRIILASKWGPTVRLVPFCFSRLLTTFLWSCRTLVRVSKSEEADAVVILARAGYKYMAPASTSVKAPVKNAIVHPTHILPSQ